MRIKRY